jgi:hypothetical protein
MEALAHGHDTCASRGELEELAAQQAPGLVRLDHG